MRVERIASQYEVIWAIVLRMVHVVGPAPIIDDGGVQRFGVVLHELVACGPGGDIDVRAVR